jgi:TolB-like protein
VESGDDIPAPPRPVLFVSYSRTDLAHARPVIDLLEQAGFDAWWDGRLEGGENYLQTTEQTLETSACVVVLWSATSVNSHWVRDEAQRGRERGCLVPLTIDGTMAPLGFRQFQLLDISSWDGSPESPEAARILVAVRAKANAASPAPAPAPASVLAPPVTSRPAPASPPAGGLALSRRTLMIGGAAAAGGAGLLGAWQFGLFGSPASAAISMVVLPFGNETGDPDKKYFSDGLSRELRAVLARNPRLKVAAPASSNAIEGEDDFAIGRKLGVSNILRGGVQRDTDRVRVSTELVAIEDGEVLWAKSFDSALEDVFAVQSEIAEAVAVSLVAEIASDAEAKQSLAAQSEIGGTQIVEAYEAFLRGMALYDLGAGGDSTRSGLAQFDAAIAADPDYAAAHAMRATMLLNLAVESNNAGETRRLFAEAITAAKRAIALEKRLAQGHLALGFALNNGQLNRAAALPSYQIAERLGAGDGDLLRQVATFYSYGAEHQRAGQIIETALELDPLNARAFRSAGFVALLAHDYPKVISRMERALELNPTLASVYYAMAVARLMQGDAAGALVLAGKERTPIFRLTATAVAAARLGDAAGSAKAFDQTLADYGDAALYQQAQIKAQQGDKAAALALLGRAISEGDPGLLWAPNDPLLDPLRGEPAFKDLLIRLGS